MVKCVVGSDGWAVEVQCSHGFLVPLGKFHFTFVFCTHVALSVRWVWKSHVDKSRNTIVGHLHSNIYKDFHDDIYRRFAPVAAQSPLMHAYCIATFPI